MQIIFMILRPLLRLSMTPQSSDRMLCESSRFFSYGNHTAELPDNPCINSRLGRFARISLTR